MIKEYLGQSGVISTYYLKTIMMWAIEQNRVEYWSEDNIGQVVLGLLDHLYKAVITGYLSYYLIPQNNLPRHFLEEYYYYHFIQLQCKTAQTYTNVMLVSVKCFEAFHAKLVELLSRKEINYVIEYRNQRKEVGTYCTLSSLVKIYLRRFEMHKYATCITGGAGCGCYYSLKVGPY